MILNPRKMSSRDLLYEKGTDATAGTYITNYILSAQLFVQAIVLTLHARPLYFDIKNRSYAAPLFFMLHGVVYLSAGITHQYICRQESPGLL